MFSTFLTYLKCHASVAIVTASTHTHSEHTTKRKQTLNCTMRISMLPYHCSRYDSKLMQAQASKNIRYATKVSVWIEFKKWMTKMSWKKYTWKRWIFDCGWRRWVISRNSIRFSSERKKKEFNYSFEIIFFPFWPNQMGCHVINSIFLWDFFFYKSIQYL